LNAAFFFDGRYSPFSPSSRTLNHYAALNPTAVISVEHMKRFANLSANRLYDRLTAKLELLSLKPTPSFWTRSTAQREEQQKQLKQSVPEAQAAGGGAGTNAASATAPKGIVSALKNAASSMLRMLTPSAPVARPGGFEDEDEDSPSLVGYYACCSKNTLGSSEDFKNTPNGKLVYG